MSRTDAHLPYAVRERRGELPDDPYQRTCWCRTCYQPRWRRWDLRHERRRVRRALTGCSADADVTRRRRGAWGR